MAQIEGDTEESQKRIQSWDWKSKQLIKRQVADSLDFTVHCKLWKDRNYNMNGVGQHLLEALGDGECSSRASAGSTCSGLLNLPPVSSAELQELPGEIYGTSPSGALFRSCWDIWRHQSELNPIMIQLLDSSLLTPFRAVQAVCPDENRKHSIELAETREAQAEEIYDALQSWARNALSRETATDSNDSFNPSAVEVAARSRLRYFVVARYKLALEIMSRSLQEVDLFWSANGARLTTRKGTNSLGSSADAAAMLSAAAATVSIGEGDQPDPDDHVLDWVQNPRW